MTWAFLRKIKLGYSTIEEQDEVFAYNANHTFDNAYNKSTANDSTVTKDSKTIQSTT
jgi:hypothetical protein